MKNCECGNSMDIKLCSVFYTSEVEIVNVPVYSCSACGQSTVSEVVKPELKRLMNDLGDRPEQQRIDFCDVHELAYLLFAASDEARLNISVPELINGRINQLLDLMIVAKMTGDQNWQSEIKAKLSQITLLDVLIEADPEHNEI